MTGSRRTVRIGTERHTGYATQRRGDFSENPSLEKFWRGSNFEFPALTITSDRGSAYLFKNVTFGSNALTHEAKDNFNGNR